MHMPVRTGMQQLRAAAQRLSAQTVALPAGGLLASESASASVTCYEAWTSSRGTRLLECSIASTSGRTSSSSGSGSSAGGSLLGSLCSRGGLWRSHALLPTAGAAQLLASCTQELHGQSRQFSALAGAWRNSSQPPLLQQLLQQQPGPLQPQLMQLQPQRQQRSAQLQCMRGILLMPRRVKHRKAHKGLGFNETICPNTRQLVYGLYGIRAMEHGRVPARTLEAVRRTLRRSVKKTTMIWFRVSPGIPVSRKPAEVRMGKGKGAVDHYAAPIRPGQILFELDRLPRQAAMDAVTAIAPKMPIKVGFVEWR